MTVRTDTVSNAKKGLSFTDSLTIRVLGYILFFFFSFYFISKSHVTSVSPLGVQFPGDNSSLSLFGSD